jgi:16S rRNA (cytidine1402-2'-O)-methyltransferase
MLPAGLHLVATPIGNLGDMSPRARDTLAGCDRILCEDTRHTGRLLHHLGIDRRLARFDDHTGSAAVAGWVAELVDGRRLALVSDAGTPLISDPGLDLVRAARAAGVAVHAVPGPSAVVLAVALSGLPTDRFTFTGFVPRKGGPRREWIAELAVSRETWVCFESPHRLAATLEEISGVIGPERPVAVCRELTKLHEEVLSDNAAKLADHYRAHPPKGEVTLVIAGTGRPRVAQVTDAEIALLHALVGEGSITRRRAAQLVSAVTGSPVNGLYQALKSGDRTIATDTA